MFEIKKGDAFKAYFKIVDSTDFATPENGVLNTGVTGAYTKNGGAAVTLDMAAANRWTDLSGSVSGLYVITIPTGAVDTLGELIVAVIDDGAGVAGAARVFKVVSHPSDDIYDKVSAGILVTSINNAVSANITDACSIALQNTKLDKLILAGAGVSVAGDVHVSSVLGKMMNKLPGTAWGYDESTDSLEAIRANQAGADAAAIADAVWNELSTGHVVDGMAGYQVWNKINSLSSVVSQVLSTAKGNSVALAALADINAAEVEDACSLALQNSKLDQLMNKSVVLGTDVHLDSAIGQLLDNGTAWTYDRTADSLEEIGAAAGGTDWSANEKTEFRAILGITDTGTPGNPTDGVLFDDLLDGKVWDETKAAHVGANTFGKILQDIETDIAALNDPTVGAIADAVWEELSTGHVVDGMAGNQLWNTLDKISTAVQGMSTSIKAISNVVINDIDPSINGISNVVRTVGVAFHTSSISHASSHLLHQAHITIGQTDDFSTVAGSLRLSRAGAIGDWTVSADALNVMDVDGTSQKSLALTPGGGPYTARA